jgi:hypothetical protein
MIPELDHARVLLIQRLSLQRAVQAFTALAGTSAFVGRRAVYSAWASRLTEDWRSVALLAARVDLGDVTP